MRVVQVTRFDARGRRRDGAMEETFRSRAPYEFADASHADGFAEDGDATGIAAERGDVIAYPPQPAYYVAKLQIGWHVRVSPPVHRSEDPLAEPEDAHHHFLVRGELFAGAHVGIVEASRSRIATPVEEDHHRRLAAAAVVVVVVRWRPDADAQNIEPDPPCSSV